MKHFRPMALCIVLMNGGLDALAESRVDSAELAIPPGLKSSTVKIGLKRLRRRLARLRYGAAPG